MFFCYQNRNPRTSLSITLLGLRFTGNPDCHGLCKEKPIRVSLPRESAALLCIFVSSVHPLLPVTDACILVSSSLAFSFRLPFCEALPPSGFCSFLLLPPSCLTTAPTGTYTIKNSSPPAASRSASPRAERLAPGTHRTRAR